MSKTLEIVDNYGDGKAFTLYSPDHNKSFDINSYAIEAELSVLYEAGRLTTNIDDHLYYHIDITDANGGHAIISVDDCPQNAEYEFSLRYTHGYTFSDLVAGFDIPETEEAYNELKNLPEISIDMQYSTLDGKSIESVTIDDTEYVKKEQLI